MGHYYVNYRDEKFAKWAFPTKRYNSDDWRSCHKHDIDEIVYLNAYRKLAQRTQVVVRPVDDIFRTRLTHTLEVAQIADNFSYILELNRDLTRAIAFAHDIGQPPFAHVGEETLGRLLSSSVERIAKGLGASPKDIATIKEHFGFKHAHNSRRILQRKTKDVSCETVNSVVGHGWSPWKNCSSKITVDDIQMQLHQDLLGENNHFDLLLPCYEAQAVALSDQISGLNSDVEDLINLNRGDTKSIRDAAFRLLGRYQIEGLDVKCVEEIVNEGISEGSGATDRRGGWGRKNRLGQALAAIISNSEEKVRRCNSYKDSLINPLTPPIEMAVALDILEKATRNIVYTDHEIRLRDTVAESAVTTMFQSFLSLEFEFQNRIINPVDDKLANKMRQDFKQWRRDYENEVRKETKLDGVYSEPSMHEKAEIIPELWENINPYITVVDYISEMTDQYVVHFVFSDHPFQSTLNYYFDRGLPDENAILS
jgi:dGTP triphosphohydrolase